MNDFEAKAKVCMVGKRLYDRSMVAGCDGNISIRVSENEIWITPTGVSKGFLTEDILVKVDLDGNILEGSNPTSEMPMHLEAYKNNPNIKAVVHAHPVMATTFSVAGLPINSPILIESVYGLGAIPVADYFPPGSVDLAKSIIPFVLDYRGCLLAHHGATTWGKSIEDAINFMETLEQCAIILYNVRTLSKENYIPGFTGEIGGRSC